MAVIKSRYWIALLALLLLGCSLACIPLLTAEPAPEARIIRDETVVHVVNLASDQEFTVDSGNGHYNTITIRNGKIAVTDASCPDHYCMDRGFCAGGTPIVCLPNRLIIEFVGEQEIDGKIG